MNNEKLQPNPSLVLMLKILKFVEAERESEEWLPFDYFDVLIPAMEGALQMLKSAPQMQPRRFTFDPAALMPEVFRGSH